MHSIKVGDKVIVTERLCAHSYKIGKTYRVSEINAEATRLHEKDDMYLSEVDGSKAKEGHGYYISASEVRTFRTRAEYADWLESKELASLNNKRKQIMGKIEALELEIKSLRRFPSDTEEVASIIAACIKCGSDEWAIAKVLDASGIKLTLG